MGAVATRAPNGFSPPLVGGRPAARRPDQRLFEPSSSGEVSLEDWILAAWEDLIANGRAGCPICEGRMDAGTGCDSCGSELS